MSGDENMPVLPVIAATHGIPSIEESPKRKKRRRVFQAPTKRDAAVDKTPEADDGEDDFFEIGKATRLRAEAKAENLKRQKQVEEELKARGEGISLEATAAGTENEDGAECGLGFNAGPPSHLDNERQHSFAALDENSIDEHGLMDSSDIEILGESYDMPEQLEINETRMDIPSAVAAVELEPSPLKTKEEEPHDEFSDKLRQFLAMGLDVTTATSMVDHLRRQKATASFSTNIQVRAYNPDLRKFDRSFEIKSTEKFEVLKELYMKYLESEGISSQDTLHQHASRCTFVASTVAVGLDASPVTINVRSSDPNLVLQLMTPEEQAESKRLRLEARLKAIEAQTAAQSGGDDDLEAEEGDQEEQNAVPQETGSFPVLMRGADQVEHKVRVRPETEIQKLIESYKKKMELGNNVNVVLEFDNERLDPKSTIADTELEEDDNIDVFIK